MAMIEGAATVASLIETALRERDQEGAARWRAITRLQERGDLETFTAARRLCSGKTAAERMLGVDILGRLGFVDRTLPVLRALSVSEDDRLVLYSVLIAFGHLRDRRALPSVIALSEHADPRIRYGAAYALPNIMGSPPDPTGLAALRRLTLDPDGDVADWARLGLALSTGREVEDVRRNVLDP
ncbi:HEAT repeat domain-containing protein [Streptosporangium amethystogenes]|uniref:HEAT repeat domain-containing protein n=1 Tax=Streptosporangium amethystogenes TaxID=2002 RepID=UPI0004C6F30E|nr:HEAT repeat domain-containing protein [Streptosporangium amethystogenes]